MSAIAFDLPENIRNVCKEIITFADDEILPRHEANRELLGDPRRRFQEDGRLSQEVEDLITEVRVAAAKAGFYAMCTPTELGGGGLGHLAYYAAWERLFHHCGPKNWLMLYVVSHWAFGPSRLLEKTTDEGSRSASCPRSWTDRNRCASGSPNRVPALTRVGSARPPPVMATAG